MSHETPPPPPPHLPIGPGLSPGLGHNTYIPSWEAMDDIDDYRNNPADPANFNALERGAVGDLDYYTTLRAENKYGEFNDVLRPPLVNSDPRPTPSLGRESSPKHTSLDEAHRRSTSAELGRESVAATHEKMKAILVKASSYINQSNIETIRRITEDRKKQYPHMTAQFEAEFAHAKEEHDALMQGWRKEMGKLIKQHPSVLSVIEEAVDKRTENLIKSRADIKAATRTSQEQTAVVTGHSHPSVPAMSETNKSDDRTRKSSADSVAHHNVSRHKALEDELVLFAELLKGNETIDLLIGIDVDFDRASEALANATTENVDIYEHELYATTVRLRNDVQKIRDWKEHVDQASTDPEDHRYTNRRFAEIYSQYATIDHARRLLLIESEQRNPDGTLDRDHNGALSPEAAGSVEFARYDVRDAKGVVRSFTDGSIVATRQSLTGDTQTIALYPDGSYRTANPVDGTWGPRTGVYGKRINSQPERGQLTDDELAAFDPLHIAPDHNYFFNRAPSQENFIQDDQYVLAIWDEISDVRALWLETAGNSEAEADLREVLLYARASLAHYAARPNDSSHTPEQWRNQDGVRLALSILHQADYIQATLDNNRIAEVGKRFRRKTIRPYQVRPDGYVDVRDPNNPDFYYRLLPNGSRYYNGRVYEPGDPDPVFKPPTPSAAPAAPPPASTPPTPPAPPTPTPVTGAPTPSAFPPRPATPPPAPSRSPFGVPAPPAYPSRPLSPLVPPAPASPETPPRSGEYDDLDPWLA